MALMEYQEKKERTFQRSHSLPGASHIKLSTAAGQTHDAFKQVNEEFKEELSKNKGFLCSFTPRFRVRDFSQCNTEHNIHTD